MAQALLEAVLPKRKPTAVIIADEGCVGSKPLVMTDWKTPDFVLSHGTFFVTSTRMNGQHLDLAVSDQQQVDLPIVADITSPQSQLSLASLNGS